MIQLTPDQIIQRGIYIQCFYGWGLLPLLLLLEWHEGNENYIECFFIKAAIDEINRQFAQNYPTRNGKAAERMITKIHQEKGVDFEEYKKTLPKQTEDCYQYAKELKKQYKIDEAAISMRNGVLQLIINPKNI